MPQVVDSVFTNNVVTGGAAALHVMCGGLPCNLNLTRVTLEGNRHEYSDWAQWHYWAAHNKPNTNWGYSCAMYTAAAFFMSDYATGSIARVTDRQVG